MKKGTVYYQTMSGVLNLGFSVESRWLSATIFECGFSHQTDSCELIKELPLREAWDGVIVLEKS